MKKIIHLSDLHVGFRPCKKNFLTLVNKIISSAKPASDYILVMTGDLVDNATVPANHSNVRKGIDRLHKAGFKTLVVPGNHDYGTGSHGYKKYVSVFKAIFFGTTDVEYPKLDIIDDVAFIGLDSTAEELHWYDCLFAQGELGEEQLSKLAELLRNREVRQCARKVVYLHHHPFEPRLLHELRDSADLKAVIAGKIDALLFGHNHAGNKWNGTWNIPRCYDGGSSTRKKGFPGPAWVMDLSAHPKTDYDANYISRGL